MSATMRRFHEHYVGQPDLWHGYCDEHPSFELDRCGTEEDIQRAVDAHNAEFHQPPLMVTRAIEIGHELLAISKAIDEARTAYSNAGYARGVETGRGDLFESELFAQLDARRTVLRNELLEMG